MLGGMYSREALQHNPWIRWWMSPFPHRSGWTLDLRRRVSPSTNYWTYPSHSKPIRLRLICTAPQAVNMGIFISIIIKSNTQTQRTTLALFCRRFLVFFHTEPNKFNVNVFRGRGWRESYAHINSLTQNKTLALNITYLRQQLISLELRRYLRTGILCK